MDTMLSTSNLIRTGYLECKHCQTAIPQGRMGDFCCQGCETVYGLLNQNGLHDYYQIRKDGVCFTAPQPVSLNTGSFEFFTNSLDVRFFLEGVHCSACLWLLEKLPIVMPAQVADCSLSLGTSVLNVHLKNTSDVNAVASMIQSWGYRPYLISSKNDLQDRIQSENRMRLLDVGIAGAISGNVMLMSIPLYSGVAGSHEALFEWLSFGLSMPSLFYSGRSFFINVYSGMKSRTFPIDGPILLALLVAFFYSVYSLIQGTHELYFDSLTALIFLLLSSRYYLSRLRQSSQLSFGILDFFQTESSVQSGQLVSLKAGERVSFDGVVRAGQAWIDSSQFTGESEPVLIQVGDSIQAGTLVVSVNEEFRAEVEKTGDQTRLARLLSKVSEVQSKRTQTELKSDQWSKFLLMTVTSIAALSFSYFWYQNKPAEGLRRVLALLIVTCPCALALATPLVFTLAMKTLLKKGLLVKDPSALDRIPEIHEIYFDKTGTLTRGVLESEFNPDEMSVQDRSVLYSMSRRSRHPASRAIERKLQAIGTDEMGLDSFDEKQGLGLFSRFGADQYSLIRADHTMSGLTESVFMKNGQIVSRIQFSDQIRPESEAVVYQLKKSGFGLNILSGDHAIPVSRLAQHLQIDHWKFHLAPEQKASLSQNGMMVGDGVNDSLALSTAKVSVAVQGGMEAAIHSAQVYSLKPGVSVLPDLIRISKKVRIALRQNLILSTSYNLIGAILSLSGWMNPLWAAVLMPASALTVFWSSMIRMKEND